MKFKGDGLAQQVEYVSNGFIATLENRSASFELPSLLAIGGSYDFILSDESRLSLSASFQANSFSKDQYKFPEKDTIIPDPSLDIKDTKNNHIKIRFVGDINGEKKYYFKNNLFYKNKI